MTMSRSMDDGRGLRPVAVTAAAALAAVAGTPTFALSAVFSAAMVMDLFDLGLSTDPRWIITLLLWSIQLVGSFLLVVGGLQLANGTGRGRLVAGASMLLPLFPAHLYYIEMELRRDTAEGDLWKIALPCAITFAITIATILTLASRRSTAEYLRPTT